MKKKMFREMYGNAEVLEITEDSFIIKKEVSKKELKKQVKSMKNSKAKNIVNKIVKPRKNKGE